MSLLAKLQAERAELDRKERDELVTEAPEKRNWSDACKRSSAEAAASIEKQALRFAEDGGLGRVTSTHFAAVLRDKFPGLSIDSAHSIRRRLGR
jgi:hypothetical protein